MTSEELISCIQNNKVEATELEALNEFVEAHPYASSLQQLIGFAKNTLESLKKASVYSGHPFLFVHYKNSFNKASFNVTAIANETKPEKSASAQQIDTILNRLNEPVTEVQDSEAPIFTPLHTEDYFLAQGIKADSEEVTEFVLQEKSKHTQEEVSEDNQLLVTMSFGDWLQYFKEKKRKEEKENEEKQALRAMWQKQKLGLAMEEENDVVPEAVFNQAINSISLSESTISESFADILSKQGKKDRAEEMYRKLSLINPEKSAYFASKIKNLHNN
jgi:hypothetical protein